MKKLIQTLSLACLLTAALSLSAYAQSIDTAGFTVRAILPDNQVAGGNSYFDLRMEPGKSQELEVEVHNITDTALALNLSLRAASTNRNGIIEYLIEKEPDETLRIPFNTIAQAPSEVSLAPNEQKRVSIRVNMPQESFDGAILGGIVFAKKPPTGQAEGIGVSNQFSYVIGVRLTETDAVVSPDFDLKSVNETLINYRTAVVANIRNTEPVVVKDATAAAQVYKDNDTTPLFTANKSGVDFAPNSVFSLPVEWEGQRIEPGNYRMSVQLNHAGEAWTWDQNFSISRSQANDVNNGAVQSPSAPTPGSLIWGGAIFLMLLLALFAFYLGRRSRRSRPDELN